MRYIKKIIFMLSCFGVFSSISLAASTETFRYGDYIKNAYFLCEKDGIKTQSQVQFINSNSSNNVFYPLDYNINLDVTKTYIEKSSGQADILHISNEDWEQVQALAYFGYMYPGHEEPLWYAVTWEAINRIINPNTNMYITGSLNGIEDSRTIDMLKELNKLIDNNININLPPYIELNYGETKSIYIDDLKIYKIISLTNNAKTNLNTLTVTGNNPGGEWIELERLGENSSIYEVNDGSNSTKFIMRKNVPKVKKKIELKVISGFLDINFKQPEYKDYNNCSNTDKTTYGLFTQDGVLKDTYELNDLSQFQTGYLPYGNYYIKQLKNACNVKKDTNLYDIAINKYQTSKTISLKENYKEIKLNKKVCNFLKCSNESNAEFMITDGINEYIVKTNQLGNAYINLGMGKYKLKQIKGTDNYNYSDEIEFNLDDYNADEVNFDLTSMIKKGSITINIKDDNNMRIKDGKVCLYSGNKLVKCNISNSNGIIIFSDIDYGDYYIKEEEISDEYTINKTKLKVSLLNNNSDVINIVNKIKKTQEDISNDIKDNNLDDLEITDELKLEDIPETSIKSDNSLIYIIIIIGSILFLVKKYQH